MKTIEINLYKFIELSKEVQEKIIQNNWELNIDQDWHTSIYEDAEAIGIEIKSFDLDRNFFCKGNFIASPLDVANRIIKEHGAECETFKTATDFLTNHDKLVAKHSNGEGEVVSFEKQEAFEIEEEELKEKFKRDLFSAYLGLLQTQYEYLTSEEAILETIEDNDYDFTEKGEIY